jgi:predicted permease
MKWWRRNRRENDLDRELLAHLELEAAEQRESGLMPEEAQYAAKRALGNAGLLKENLREIGRWVWLDQFRQDAVYAARTFARTPGSTAVVILTLALGIGATTAIFSVVNAVLLNPLPFRNADRLVVIWEKFVRSPNDPPFADAYRDFEVWKKGSHSFERLTPAIWNAGPQVLTGSGPARIVVATHVGIDFFPMLGMAPELGRMFQPDDLEQGCTVVLKHRFWMQAFSGQTNVIGKHITLNENACTIVGVMPPEFAFYPEQAALWMLITPGSSIARNPGADVLVFGLLKAGVPVVRAQQEVEALYRNSPGKNPDGIQRTPVIYPVAEQFARLTGPTLRMSVAILLGAVILVLLIGCLNIANLLLGKSVARQKEMALRAALGSGRVRLARQLLTEALLLSFTGAALGILLAMGAVHCFKILNPIAMPPGNPVAVNLPVLGFTASLAVVTALLFGLVPALKGSRVDLMDALRMTAQTAMLSPTARKLRRVLVIVEVALSLVLLASAGLLIESLQRLASEPLGFRPERVISMPVNLPKSAYPGVDQRARFYRAAAERVALAPAVVSAAFASSVPPDERFGGYALALGDRPQLNPAAAAFDVAPVSVSPDYFRVMGVPLQLGRLFDNRDTEKSPAVAIVNEALVRKYFRRENPIGQRIKVVGAPGPDPPWRTIVGIVADEKDQNFFHPMNWEETPAVFLPMNQDAPSRVLLVVRTTTDGIAPAAEIQKEIATLDQNVPISNAQTINERLSRALSYPRFRAIILTAFAGLALLLAAIGLYAVLAQLIAQRTQEFGIRMALGAEKSDLLKLVIREGMLLACAGLAAGLLLTLSLTRLLSSLLYGVKAADPLILTVVCLLLAVVAFCATYIPARRASGVDPMVALRYE